MNFQKAVFYRKLYVRHVGKVVILRARKKIWAKDKEAKKRKRKEKVNEDEVIAHVGVGGGGGWRHI